MKYIIKNLIVPVHDEAILDKYLSQSLKKQFNYINNWTVLKRALDTRKKNFPQYVFTLELNTNRELTLNHNLTKSVEIESVNKPSKILSDINPFIIGMGPAGLFCALSMVENGLKPILFDQGDCLENRSIIVNEFWTQGTLNKDCNVQFGEGGAGAFSDGKLTSRTSSLQTSKVFEHLIKFGADPSIKWEAHPHLGTEVIRDIVKKIRQYLIDMGCVFYYNHKMDSIKIVNDRVTEITINGNIYNPEMVVLALGNSARKTFKMLHSNSLAIESKAFAVGFRISHPQDWIDYSIYGSNKWSDLLGAASYRLTSNNDGYSAYTFCMCPGGHIIAATSEVNSTVTNGMSYNKRDGKYGNSAIVTSIGPKNYGSEVFSGMSYQDDIEKKAFINNYSAPYQSAEDYLNNTLSMAKSIDCLFPNTMPYMISNLFSESINNSLKQGLIHFNRIMPGFISKGLIIAPETRTSCPIRIVRNRETLSCLNINNLYAIGEGSGYAGGIVSSAADGYRIGSLFTAH
jgi:hypothetical protein